MARIKKDALTLEERLEQALVSEDGQPYKAPNNWVWTRLGEYINFATDYVANGSFASLKENVKMFKEENYALMVKTQDFSNNFSQSLTFTDRHGYEFLKKSSLFGGELILSNIGSIGKVFRVPHLNRPMTLASNSIMIKCYDDQHYDYLYYFLLSPIGTELLLSISTATTVRKINKTDLKTISIPLPPLTEQQRITERIESLFEKLDRARELVQSTLDSFKPRKASILHKAFTGELTAKWRAENDVGRDSWSETSIGNECIVNPKRTDIKGASENIFVSFVPMPSVSDVLGEITNYISRPLVEVKKGYTSFEEGDVIFAKITPCMENGKSAIVGKLQNGIGFGSTEFHVLRCNESMDAKYLYHLIRSQKFRDKARSVMTGAVGQQRVPKGFIQEYKIALPSLPEQQEIVRILDNLFEQEQKAKELSNILDQIDLMKKSILARAFRGQLGTNDPNEESAIELLKKVLSEQNEVN